MDEAAPFEGWENPPDDKGLPQPTAENRFAYASTAHANATAQLGCPVNEAIETIQIIDQTRKLAVSRLPKSAQDELNGAAQIAQARKKTAVIYAMRIMRREMSWVMTRRWIAEQISEGLHKVNGR